MSLRKDIDKLEKPLLGILNKSFPFEEDWHMGQSGVPRSSLDAQVVFGHQQHGLTVKVDLVLGQTLRIVATYEGWIAGKKVHTGSKFFSGPPLPSLKGPEVSKWFTAETSKFRAALKKTYDYMGESKVQENTPNAQRLINEALSKSEVNESRGDWAEINPRSFEREFKLRPKQIYRVIERYTPRAYVWIQNVDIEKGKWFLSVYENGRFSTVGTLTHDAGNPATLDFGSLTQKAEKRFAKIMSDPRWRI